MLFTATLISALSLVSLSSAHCLISAASGDLGGKGQGLGVTAKGINNQNDVTVFKASAGAFGETALVNFPSFPLCCFEVTLTHKQGGNNVLATGLAAQQKITGNTIPQISSTAGVVTMTLHQLNADGAGPMTCSVSADATGKKFVAMKVTAQVPGTNGRSNAANQDFPLVADMPAGTACTGTVGALKNVCAVKCANPAGPFGGVVLVQQAAAKKARSFGGSLAARAMSLL